MTIRYITHKNWQNKLYFSPQSAVWPGVSAIFFVVVLVSVLGGNFMERPIYVSNSHDPHIRCCVARQYRHMCSSNNEKRKIAYSSSTVDRTVRIHVINAILCSSTKTANKSVTQYPLTYFKLSIPCQILHDPVIVVVSMPSPRFAWWPSYRGRLNVLKHTLFILTTDSRNHFS